MMESNSFKRDPLGEFLMALIFLVTILSIILIIHNM